MIWMKKYGHMIAACDEGLLGKAFEEGEKVLIVKESFYKGKLVSEDDFLREVKKSNNMNLVGPEVIEAINTIMKVHTGTIKNVPYAIIIRV